MNKLCEINNLTIKQEQKAVKNVVQVLMERDGLTAQEAKELVQEAYQAALAAYCEGMDPEEVWTDMTGLEPDYLF